MNIENYSLEELKILKSKIENAIDTFEIRALEKARSELEDHAKSLGFSLDQILHAKPKRAAVAIKYRDPNNAQNTWTGRGRQPKWVKAFLGTGKTLEDLKI